MIQGVLLAAIETVILLPFELVLTGTMTKDLLPALPISFVVKVMRETVAI